MHLPFHVRHPAFDHAIQRLRDGRVGESAYGRRIALLLTIPAFHDPVARDIRRSVTGELYVVRTAWQRALDMPTIKPARSVHVGPRSVSVGLDLLATRAPTLVSARIPADADELDALLASVSSATVPCQVQQLEPPLDATIFELTFGDELNETRYRWTSDPPEAWAPLATFASRLMRLVDEPAHVDAR
jgi:hypothetical protein